MNFALPALLIVYLVSPGLIFFGLEKRPFAVPGRDARTAERSPKDFTKTVAYSALWSTPFHAILVWLLETLDLLEVRIDWLVLIVTGIAPAGSLERDYAAAIKAVEDNIQAIFLYWVVSCVLAFILVGLVRLSVRLALRCTELDRRIGWLRPDHPFFAQATGYVNYLQGLRSRRERVADIVVMGCMVEQAGAHVLYSGVLEEYTWRSDKEIEYLVLSDASRRQVEFPVDEKRREQEETPDDWIPVTAERVLLDRSRVVNISFEYYYFSDVVEDEDPAATRFHVTVHELEAAIAD